MKREHVDAFTRCPRLFEGLPFIMDKFLLQQQVLERKHPVNPS